MKQWENRLTSEIIDDYRDKGFWESQKTLNDYFYEALACHPQKELIIDRERRYTYQEMDKLIDALAGGLQALAVTEDDVVSFQLPNWLEAFATYMACKRLGAVCNPIIPIYRSREVGFILKQAGSKVIIIPDQFRNCDYTSMLKELQPELPTLQQIVVVGDNVPPGAMGFNELLKLGRNSSFQLRADRVLPNDISILIYTSGTTSEPKGVLHTHNTMLWEAKSVRDVMNLDDHAVILGAAPVTHIGGLFSAMELPVLLGGTVVFQDIWDPTRALQLIQGEKCTAMTGPTPFLQGIVTHPKLDEFDLTSFERFGCGGAPVPPDLVYRAERDLGIHCSRSYGLTEFSTITLARADDPMEKRAITDGRAAPGVEVRIADPKDGTIIGPGGEGEIVSRGPDCFVGYADSKLNAKAFDDHGWFHTGDLGIMDEEGHICITGRIKDIIIRGGENISIKEVEDLLHTHEKIEEVVIIGVPDPQMGEKACACVKLAQKAESLDLEEISAFLLERNVARQKLPEYLLIVEVFPHTHTGKVKRSQLKIDASRRMNI